MIVLPVWESSSVGREEATRWHRRRFQAARIGTRLERRPAKTLQVQIAEFELRALRSPIGSLFPDKKWRPRGIPAARMAFTFCFQ
jgi:hypothetical protein